MAEKYRIHIENSGEDYSCASDLSLLRGMEVLGRRGIPVGCRGGGCGVCKVQVTSGSYVSRVMSREHVSEDDEREGRVLACRVRPCSDVHLTVIGKMKKSVVRRVETADAPTSHST